MKTTKNPLVEEILKNNTPQQPYEPTKTSSPHTVSGKSMTGGYAETIRYANENHVLPPSGKY